MAVLNVYIYTNSHNVEPVDVHVHAFPWLLFTFINEFYWYDQVNEREQPHKFKVPLSNWLRIGGIIRESFFSSL